MSPAERTVLRVILAGLAASALAVGILGSVVPRTFFDEFPFFAAWVSQLPPYNEHLVTDVGGLQLAFGGLFTWAAWRPSVELVAPLCVAWAVSQALHFAFHLRSFDAPAPSTRSGRRWRSPR